MADALGDVAAAGDSQAPDGEVAQAGESVRAVAGSDLGAILVEGNIPDPVQRVLNLPVTASEASDPGRAGGLRWQAGDAVNDLAGDLAGAQDGGLALNSKDLL